MKISSELDQWRIGQGTAWASSPGDDFGAFLMPGPCGRSLKVIASPGDAHEDIPWEHVSVSTLKSTPNWLEMCFIKDLFWDAEEAVMQLHPPRSTWINNHPYCLHLWRPLKTEIPLPPEIAVGLKDLNLSATGD